MKSSVSPPNDAVSGAPFDVFYTADDRYDNLFVTVENGTDVSIFQQVRYGNLNADHGTFTVPHGGAYVARLRQPKYAAGHNRWPILAETGFTVA